MDPCACPLTRAHARTRRPAGGHMAQEAGGLERARGAVCEVLLPKVQGELQPVAVPPRGVGAENSSGKRQGGGGAPRCAHARSRSSRSCAMHVCTHVVLSAPPCRASPRVSARVPHTPPNGVCVCTHTSHRLGGRWRWRWSALILCCKASMVLRCPCKRVVFTSFGSLVLCVCVRERESESERKRERASE